MNEIKTVSDLMKMQAQLAAEIKKRGNQKNNGVLLDKILSRKRLSTSSPYNYCPRCAERTKRGEGENWRASLNPLWSVTHKLLIDIGGGFAKPRFDTVFECDVCKKEITEQDYLDCRPDRGNANKSIDLSKVDINDPEFFKRF